MHDKQERRSKEGSARKNVNDWGWKVDARAPQPLAKMRTVGTRTGSH